MSLPGGEGEQHPPRQYGLRQRFLSFLVRRLMRFFFYLIYQPMAWSYDLVAWVVSLGRWKDWVLSALPYLSEEPILELGHGPGYLQLALAQRNMKAIGLDASRQMGRLARLKLIKYSHEQRLVRGRSQALPFPSNTFHSIISTFPSEYIYHPQTLTEVRRILAPGGKLVIAPLAWITGNSPLERAARWLFHITGEAPEWNDLWLQPFQDSGFKPIQQHFIELHGSRVLVLIFEVSDKLR